MKKRIIIGISVIILLFILSFTSITQAADFAGHNFSEDFFAVEVDIAVSDPVGSPDVIHDLITGAENPDTNPGEDKQFYMNFINDSGIEVAYSALEKYEHSITLKDIFPSAAVSAIELFGTTEQKAALELEIAHVNATAPFQQLVQHFNTPWGSDAFVVNNFMALVAYSSNETDVIMDAGDDLFLGYTFSLQAIIEEINEELSTHPSGYQVPPFDFEAHFENTSEGYKFGINYTNMLVVWQNLSVQPRTPDILGVSSYVPMPSSGGIVYGGGIGAMSVIDHLAFEYTFEVEEYDLGTTPPITVLLGNVTSQYHIGETNLLITRDSQSYINSHTDNWTSSPFTTIPEYELDIPTDLEGLDLNDYGYPHPVGPLPDNVTIPLVNMAFYVQDDAKMRMKLRNDFGLSVVTATNWFDVDVVDQTFATHVVNPDRTIDLEKDGNVFFWTSFQGKDTYKLRELNFAPYNIDPNVNRDVYIQLFDPTGWAFTGVAKEYFIVEFALAFAFTKFFATNVAPDIIYPGSGAVVVDRLLYLTFTEFPEWYGGEIFHDPAYSAVAALAAEEDGTTTGPGDGDGGPIPGFELLSVLLAIPPLYALYRKRR